LANEPAARCVGVLKSYATETGAVDALRGVDVELAGGAVTAIVGASGSGKSTLLNILAGYDTPSAGTVTVGDYDLLQMTSKEIVEYRRSEVGFIWQDTSRNLFNYLTSRENVELPMLLSGVGSATRKSRAEELLDLVGLSHRMGHLPAQLSGGEQQRVAVAVSLANKPPLLLADEPTGELDDETGAQVLALLNTVNRELGATVVIVTHDPAVSGSVGRAIAIRDGRTSTETARVVSFGPKSLEPKDEPVEEFLLVDASGSVQIPREILDQLSIGRRVKVEVREGRVTLESGE
jgi:ABC-type lipoprotein export system ATPase subunit